VTGKLCWSSVSKNRRNGIVRLTKRELGQLFAGRLCVYFLVAPNLLPLFIVFVHVRHPKWWNLSLYFPLSFSLSFSRLHSQAVVQLFASRDFKQCYYQLTVDSSGVDTKRTLGQSPRSDRSANCLTKQGIQKLASSCLLSKQLASSEQRDED